MNKKHPGLLCGTALAVCALSSAVNASLIDAGNGLIYDDALNITWLKNANLAATETFGVAGIADGLTVVDGEGNLLPKGTMKWGTANEWIAAMNANNYMGFNTWRLPTVRPVNGSTFNYSRIDNGSHDLGYNISEEDTLYAGSTAHEMAHLFYNTLGNDARCAPAPTTSDDQCHDRTTAEYLADWGLVNVGPFTDTGISTLVKGRYWTGVESEINDMRAFDFNFLDGQTGAGNKIGYFYAWAVVPNPTAVVPVPAAAWLFGSGLLGLVTVARRRKSL